MGSRVLLGLVLALAAATAAWLDRLEIDPYGGEPVALSSAPSPLQIESLRGWRYVRFDPDTTAVAWRVWGESARPAGAGHESWVLEAPRLFVAAEHATGDELLASAARASVARRPGGRVVAELSGGFVVEWGGLVGSGADLLLELGARSRSGAQRRLHAVSTEPVELLFTAQAATATARARLEAGGLEIDSETQTLQLAPPVRMLLPAAALEAQLGRRYAGLTLPRPAGRTHILAGEDRLSLQTGGRVLVQQLAPGHLGFVTTQPVHASLEFAAGAPPVRFVAREPGRFTLGRHLRPDGSRAVALDAIAFGRCELWSEDGVGFHAHRLESAADGALLAHGSEQQPVRLRWGESHATARTIEFSSDGQLEFRGAFTARVHPRDLPPGLRRGLPAEIVHGPAWRAEAEQARLAARDGRETTLTLLGRGRLARVWSEPAQDRAPLWLEAERVACHSRGEQNLDVELGPADSAHALARLGHGDDRVEAERVALRARGDRLEARAQERVDAVRTAASAEGARLLAQRAALHFARGPRRRWQLVRLEAGAAPAATLQLWPERLRGQPRQPQPHPVVVHARSIGVDLAPRDAAAAPLAALTGIELEGTPEHPVRVEHTAALTLWERIADEPRSPASPQEVASEWYEARRVRWRRDRLLARAWGGIRGQGRLVTERAALPVSVTASALTLELQPPAQTAIRLARLELEGSQQSPARLAYRGRRYLAFALGLLQPPTGEPEPEPASAEWLAFAHLVWQHESRRLDFDRGVRGELGLALPDPLLLAAGASAEDAPFGLHAVRAGRAVVVLQPPAHGARLRSLDVTDGLEVRGQRASLHAQRLHYDAARRRLDLAGPPLELLLRSGRARWRPGGEVRLRLGP